MEINKIKKSLDGYDDFTKDVLTKAIDEFYQTFGEKYLTIERIIELLKRNVSNGIKICDDVGDKFDAICSLDSKEFQVNKDTLNNKEYFSYLFFHEFIHAISFNTYDGLKYMGFYSADKGEEYELKSESFNEAFTEFLTLKRNKLSNYEKENGSLSGYDLGATEIGFLSKIIGEEKLIDLYFNKPYLLPDIIAEHNMNLDEIFYSIHVFESMDVEVYNLSNRYGMNNVNDLIRIIDAERYLFYNLAESYQDIKNEQEFNNKWNFLLSENKLKYNFWLIDGIVRYGELINDASRLHIDSDNKILKKISKETLDKYTLLNDIFTKENPMDILKELNEIYTANYSNYYNLMKDDFAMLPYTFLDEIKNNYQLYDLEIYPRVYPYLKLEKAKINDVDFKKIECSEKSTKIFIFCINGNNYVECNYDDTTINKKSNTLFEFVYNDQVDILDLKNKTYKSNNQTYKCIDIY